MHTDILTPKDLFQKAVRYTIPPFQRPYVWSQDRQWEPLWEDVRNVAENYLEELERSGNNGVEAEQKTSPHFLGALVLKQVPTAAKEIDQREVIDGQQRVTTLQLLLAGIPQIKPTFLDIAPSGIPSNIIPHSKGVKCGLIRSNSPFSYSNHRPAKPKIPKPLVYAQVSPLGTSFATP